MLALGLFVTISSVQYVLTQQLEGASLTLSPLDPIFELSQRGSSDLSPR